MTTGNADDGRLAAGIAELAGALLMEIRASGLVGDELKAAGDAGSHELIVRELRTSEPEDAIRSEEASAILPGTTGRLWIVDPLDGTREFSEPPRNDWAVHVALLERGALVAGAVALPSVGAVLHTQSPPILAEASGGPPRIVVSRTRPPAHAVRLAKRLRGELVPMGSAGAKAMAVVTGAADIYAHSGGQYEWDSAAPAAVATAAGLHVSRLDGSPLGYGAIDPWLPDILICRPELAEAVLDACS